MHPFKKSMYGKDKTPYTKREGKPINSHQTPTLDLRLLHSQSIAQPISKDGKK